MKSILLFLFVIATAAADARTCRALFFQRPADGPKEVFLHDGKKESRLELASLNFSAPVDLPKGDLTLRFTAGAGEPPAGAPSVEFPASWSDCYLIFSSDPENPVLPVRVQAINASPTEMKKGDMVWINMTGSTLAGTLGDTKLDCGPLSQVKVAAPLANDGDYPVSIDYTPAGKETPLPLARTNWRHSKTDRMIVLVATDSARGGVPSIVSIRDRE